MFWLVMGMIGFQLLMFHLPFEMQKKCRIGIGIKNMEPSDHSKKSRKALISFLVFWLKDSDYRCEGPVLKLLQSLFNKMYICQRQTSISVIGDMTRATLLVKNEEDLHFCSKLVDVELPSTLKKLKAIHSTGVDH
mmetsp:Transcript_16107/g.23891  ORF Transcript_16107/g.23891 Transcript_16107/m.23891 type:complete len:135 (-) Transcript_16107:18-422(-)